MQQDVGGDVVRKIPHHAHRFWSLNQAGPRRTGFGSEQSAEVDCEYIAFDDLDIRIERKLHPQLRREHTIQFDGNQSSRAFGQQGSEYTPAGADLEYGTLRSVGQRVDDAPGSRIVHQKVLSQLRLSNSFCAL